MATEQQRLFFALWPAPAQNAALSALLARLPAGLGRPVSPANLHITLVFLGAVSAGQRQALETAADRISAPPCLLTLDRFGYWRKPQIVWAGGGRTPPPLLALVGQLQCAAQACGLKVDSRPYQAHLTLCRKVRRPPRALPEFEPLPWPVTAFSLVESCTRPAGVRYELRRTWALGTRADSTSGVDSVE